MALHTCYIGMYPSTVLFIIYMMMIGTRSQARCMMIKRRKVDISKYTQLIVNVEDIKMKRCVCKSLSQTDQTQHGEIHKINNTDNDYDVSSSPKMLSMEHIHINTQANIYSRGLMYTITGRCRVDG